MTISLKLFVAAIVVVVAVLAWFIGGIVAWPVAATVPLWYSVPLGAGMVAAFVVMGASVVALLLED